MADWWQEFFSSGTYTLLEDIPGDLTEFQTDFAVRELGLTPGDRVLDIACGIGRHSLALARRGMRVTGLDYSHRFIAQAGEAADAEGLEADFVQGDMRELPFPAGSFDAAVCLFNCLGYFETDAEDAQTLAGIARVLEPGAPLLLDVLHRDGIARHFDARRSEPFAGGTVEEERTWDARSGRIRSCWSFVTGKGEPPKTLTTRNRVYTFTEMVRMLTAAGLTVEEVWGGWGATPLTLEDDAMILKVRKP